MYMCAKDIDFAPVSKSERGHVYDILSTHIHDRSLNTHIHDRSLNTHIHDRSLNTHIHDRSLLETGAKWISLAHIYMTAHF
jgi:F0F1-type ATP synthase beta subunit